MKTGLIVIFAVVAAYVLTACEQASSPSTVDKRVAEARMDAQKQDSKALAEAAVTQAEGRHDVAIQRCNAFSGDQQKACKAQADAALDLSKANVKAQKVAADNGNSP
ncbi:MAG TPA: hypothetical protein VNZ06_07195 [Steroidobacteraceae bacterium]|nr:hypothetical protein [Steroidobacteraceae bacterium]